MCYKLLINRVYWDYNPLTNHVTNFLGHPSIQQPEGLLASQAVHHLPHMPPVKTAPREPPQAATELVLRGRAPVKPRELLESQTGRQLAPKGIWVGPFILPETNSKKVPENRQFPKGESSSNHPKMGVS